MKTTDSRDSLDKGIDALLASRPVRPTADFAERVLAAAEASRPAPAPEPTMWQGTVRVILAAAAAIACAFVLFQWLSQSSNRPQGSALSTAEVQEIFLWDEALSALHSFQPDNIQADQLLSALDVLLVLETKS